LQYEDASIPYDPSKIERTLGHYRNRLAGGSEEHFEYTMNNHAFLFKNPGKTTETIFIAKSWEGAGKDVIIGGVFENLLGTLA
jgi:hypothetical protein